MERRFFPYAWVEMTLFGRTEPLAAAERAFEAAVAGKGGVVVVTGEPGIGKSALARTLATQAEARGARIGFGRAWEVGGAPTFWPWSQALSELGLDLDEVLGSASSGGASTQRIVAFDRVVRAVCKADEAPVVVILDDLHAADVASAELALAFARAAARKRALLLVTTRESELLERRDVGELVGKLAREGTALPLRRLDESATANWLSSVGFAGDASEVHRLSEGNPLFIEEAVRLGVDRFANAAAGGVAVILSEHLARISEDTRNVLAVAAVLGREASHDDIAALAGVTLDAIETAAREGQQAGVVAIGSSQDASASPSLVFTHVLLRDSLYESLAASRRAALHVAAADRVEARGSSAPALVVRHLLAAGAAADPERVVRAACRAAEAAVLRHATDSAIEMIASTRARLAGRLTETATLMLDLAEVDATMRTAPTDQARMRAADCAARAKHLGLAAEQARAALAYGHQILSGRVDSPMVTLLEDAIAALPTGDRALRAQLLSRLASALIPTQSDEVFSKAVGHARDAIALARETNDPGTLLRTIAWSMHALNYYVPGPERVELSSELVSLAREQGADLVLADIGGFHATTLFDTGRPVAARHEVTELESVLASLPVPSLQWKATAIRATVAGIEGRLDDARALVDELRRIGAENPHARVAWALSELGLCSCKPDVERMREAAQEIRAAFAPAATLRSWMALVDALAGNEEAARAQLKPAAELTKGLPSILVCGQAAVLAEAVDYARDYYDELSRTARLGRFFWGIVGGFPIGPSQRLLGELALLFGDRELARKHFDAAIAECREIGAVPFIALCEDGRARAGGSTSTTTPTSTATATATTTNTLSLSREGDMWLVTSSTSAPFRIKHAKGIEYLTHLLESPGRETYVLVLVGADEAPEDAGAILDERAKRQYRQRVEDLQDQLMEAERNGDRGRAARAREELEAVAEQLASAVGLGGRDRKAASNVERARVNVQRRVKDAIKRIGEQDAALGRYLDATVRTGTYCVYRPM
jgi:hypothetical protein